MAGSRGVATGCVWGGGGGVTPPKKKSKKRGNSIYNVPFSCFSFSKFWKLGISGGIMNILPNTSVIFL